MSPITNTFNLIEHPLYSKSRSLCLTWMTVSPYCLVQPGSQVTFFCWRSDLVAQLLKTLHGFCLSLGITLALFSLWPLSVTLCSTHSSQAILTCLLFLEHSRNVSPMWPLYLLFLWNTLRSWLKRNFPIIYFKWEIHFSSICGLLSWLYFST